MRYRAQSEAIAQRERVIAQFRRGRSPDLRMKTAPVT